MKGIRRSLNKDKIGAPSGFNHTGGSTPSTSSYGKSQTPSYAGSSSTSSSSRVPISNNAPTPPKRVIRATQSYRAQTPQELNFEEGDFFHVVSDQGGEDWFDAANPMTGARGLVPADHFQVLGRNVRENPVQGVQVKKGSLSGSSTGGGGPSSWKAGGGPANNINPYGVGPSPSPPIASGQSRPTSTSSPRHQPLYGVVQYDFVAERADELDAKRGEPIIVIAQSNHEWFVAKPIGRLGGPGLIPVAFVEIQDMSTGKPVENVEELIKSAVVPKVEEWKKMTADYKSASIPLGRFDFGPPAVPTTQSQQPPPSQLQHTEDQRDVSPSHHHQAYDDSSYPSPHSPSYDPSNPQYQEGDVQGAPYADNRYSYSRERNQYGLVTSASVESFHQEDGSFWFHLRAFFSTGASLVLYRLYQDFYEFQIALMDEFPIEAGRVPGEEGRPVQRILPMMPGPTEYEDEVVCAQRVHDLSIYLADLCALPQHIRGSGLFYEFLVPRAGDVEVAAGSGGFGGAGGGGGSGGEEASPNPGSHAGLENQYGELVDYLDQMDPRSGSAQGQSHASRDLADQMQRLSMNGRSDRQYNGSQNGSYHESYYGQSDRQSQPPHPSSQQQQQPISSAASTSSSAPLGTANQNVPFIKIKIFHRNTDDLIAIRVPPTVSHAALLDKVRERLGSDVANLRYREEVGEGGHSPQPSNAQVVMAGGARLIGLENDNDLDRWVRSGSRLVLYAD